MKRTYPRTVYFPANDRRITLNVMPNGRFSAVDAAAPDGNLIWGLGNTELEAIADLNRALADA